MPSKIERPLLPLLHIDDDPKERLLVQEAIRATKAPFDFHGADGVHSAAEHFPFFCRATRLRGGPSPALVLLDYDLGTQCGTDFLYWLRMIHGNTAIPVVMYSGSVGHDHVGECYANGANHFLKKPQSFVRVMGIVHALRCCFSLRTPRFRFLACLPESEPDPRTAELVAA